MRCECEDSGPLRREPSLGPTLGWAAQLAKARMDARVSQYDVTPAQTHVLPGTEEAMVRGFTAQEREALLSLLERVIQNLKEDSET